MAKSEGIKRFQSQRTTTGNTRWEFKNREVRGDAKVVMPRWKPTFGLIKGSHAEVSERK